MFNWLKKNNSNPIRDIELMKSVFYKLGGKFSQIHRQLNSGLIISSVKTDTPFPNYVKFKHDSELILKNKF